MLPPLSESSMDHVHNLMSEAMIESTSESSSTREYTELIPFEHKISDVIFSIC